MDGTSPTQLDVGRLRQGSFFGSLIRWLRRPSIFRVLRAMCPFLRLNPFRRPRLYLVLRDRDVREVLSQDRFFHVEGERVRLANGGPNFLLGMQADERGCPATYRQYQTHVMSHFKLSDLPRIAAIVRDEAQSVLARADEASQRGDDDYSRLDAVRALITRTTLAVVRKYYGVQFDNDENFANCTFAVSQWLFDPPRESTYEEIGCEAAERIRFFVDAAIATAGIQAGDTIATRLVQARLDPDVARSTLFGMILGFVPTNTMAGGHILDALLESPDRLARARRAASSERGDDEQLRRCLFEAMRFKPLLRDPLRVCAQRYTVGDGTGRSHTFERGDRVIALTFSAMFDRASVVEPHTFDPDRPARDYLLFGHGLHRCIGAPMAEVHIVEALKPLLQRRGLRRTKDAKMTTLGAFPEHLSVEFEREVRS